MGKWRHSGSRAGAKGNTSNMNQQDLRINFRIECEDSERGSNCNKSQKTRMVFVK